MSWSENTESRCNNESCKATIYWNELIRHPVTKRMRPLDKPYYPDQGQEPELHLCMKKHRPGEFINKYAKEDKQKERAKTHEELFPHIPKPPAGVILGVTHLWYNNDFQKLLKCPYCNFQNIYESEIQHHIKFTEDKAHEQS